MVTLLIATRNAHKVEEIRAILGDGYRYLTLNDLPNPPEVIEDAGSFAGNATKKAVGLATWLGHEQGTPREPASSPSPALKGTLSPSEGERDGVRGRGSTPRSPQAQTRSSADPSIEPGALKAPSQGQAGQMFVLADDSGLEVDALGGGPGVHSARFAALDTGKPGNSSTADNNAKLLRLLADVPLDKRTARFRCVLALTPVLPSEAERASPVCYAEEAELQTELFEGACEGRIGFAPRGQAGFGYDPLFIPIGHDQTFAELGEEVKNGMSHRGRALTKLRARLDSAVRTSEKP